MAEKRFRLKKPEKHVCNKCGKVLDEFDEQEHLEIHTILGYGSKYDLEEVHIRLCCDCFDELVDGCKVSPLKGEVPLAGESDLPRGYLLS